MIEMVSEPIKLNLGSGPQEIPGYRSLDIKNGHPVYPLKEYEDNSVDEIRASHVLEHFSYRQVADVLREWIRVLKVGGRLRVAVPDMDWIISEHRNGNDNAPLMGYMLGGQADEHDYHKSAFTSDSLGSILTKLGLSSIQTWKSEISDCASLPVSLNLEATKTTETAKASPPAIRIAALMSAPRFGFTQNFRSMAAAMLNLGVEIFIGEGVYWDQVLTRMIEEKVHAGFNYLLTLDYDTIFLPEHIHRLYQLMEAHPEADAIVPLQTKREADHPMFGMKNESGEPISKIDVSELQKPILPITAGHFGLTIFRPKAFDKLAKPWFVGVPGPDGSWNEGRIDPDIYFWQNWIKAGNTAFLATNVRIGHAQNLYTWPDTPEKNWAPIHQYAFEFSTNGPPKTVKDALAVEVTP